MIRVWLWVALCILLSLPAEAAESAQGYGIISELRVGALAHDVPYLWSGFSREPIGVDLNAEIIFTPALRLWGGTLRPALGGTFNFEGYTSKAYLDARWQRDLGPSWFYALGVGVAVHDGETMTADRDFKQLGRRVLFHPTAEIGYRADEHKSVSLYFEHISNATTASVNEGLDAVGVRYGLRF